MKPVIDMDKEYGIVFDGGGARGAYQIGAWRALKEAGVRINAVAGTSVGALNGALVCMDDLKQAEHIWSEMTFSRVMDVEDEWMERLFNKETTLVEIIKELHRHLKEGGVDITPLRELIHEVIDEEKIRTSGKEFCLLTFSLSQMRELDLSMEDIPEGLLEDFLLASAYLIGFKNEKLHGQKYVDGGVVNNVPLSSLVKRGYKDIIQIRIYGPGREPRVKMPKDGTLYEIAPRIHLGSIIEFESRRSRKNLKTGYFDAKRVLYGLEGQIYYIEQTHEEWYYKKKLEGLSEIERAEIAFVLKLPLGSSEKELYMAMAEASARLLQIPKYEVYTMDEFVQKISNAYEKKADKVNLPRFVHKLMEAERKPGADLAGRHFLTLLDFTKEEITYLLDLAADFKEKRKLGAAVDVFRGMNIALIFEKTSTRTRCAFEVAASDLGIGTTYLAPSASQIGKKESIADTARVLGRMYDGIEYRGFGQNVVEELAQYAGVPVWNGLTNEFHPTQLLADMLTIREKFGYLEGIKIAYLGDARYNMGRSMAVAAAKMGMHLTICAPAKYFPEPALVERCRNDAEKSGGSITLEEDVRKGTKGAEVIVTDVWVSMGEPQEVWEERIRELSPYRVTKAVMENGAANTVFMHCLPAFHDLHTEVGKEIYEKYGLREMEVTDEVFSSEQSVVFDEAENRMHTIKAVIAATLGY